MFFIKIWPRSLDFGKKRPILDDFDQKQKKKKTVKCKIRMGIFLSHNNQLGSTLSVRVSNADN